ncbi:MAG TPA: sulfatase [Pirellulaceae bacterium]|nr:sulfatase [Pirellulaceae bacterium]
MFRRFFIAAVFMSVVSLNVFAAERPNIVWIVVEDMSPQFGCYGETTIKTPNVDRLAAEGTQLSRAFVTAPICSTCRSALITGMYQTSIGAHHHRSGRGTRKIHLPAGVEPLPVLFQRAGYYTTNGAWQPRGNQIGKTDYNFEWDPKIYDGNDWSGRKEGQPFFAQIQLVGGKYRDGANWRQRAAQLLPSVTDPADVKLPPYYPDVPGLRDDWAKALDAVRYTDVQVGEIIQRLNDEKLLDSTVIFFITDHGISTARGKQFLYDEGTHIPFIVRGPGIEAGKVRDDPVEHIDMAAASLALARIEVPPSIQGRNILAKNYRPREVVFAARDRADETVERIRSARSERYKYIRNYYPQRPHLQPNNYKDHKPCLIALRQARADGKLSELQERLLFSPTRPAEELYDLNADRWEMNNLANDPAHASALADMRKRLDRWIEETNDHGRQPEPAKMYDSDMAQYLGTAGKKGRNEQLEKNITLMMQWAAEGK